MMKNACTYMVQSKKNQVNLRIKNKIQKIFEGNFVILMEFNLLIKDAEEFGRQSKN